MPMDPSTSVGVHEPAPPVRSVEVTAWPAWSTPTHRSAIGHDTATSNVAPSASVTVHAEVPPLGAVDVTTSPVSSTATHNDDVGQDTASRLLAPSTSATDQAGAPAGGVGRGHHVAGIVDRHAQ